MAIRSVVLFVSFPVRWLPVEPLFVSNRPMELPQVRGSPRPLAGRQCTISLPALQCQTLHPETSHPEAVHAGTVYPDMVHPETFHPETWTETKHTETSQIGRPSCLRDAYRRTKNTRPEGDTSCGNPGDDRSWLLTLRVHGGRSSSSGAQTDFETFRRFMVLYWKSFRQLLRDLERTKGLFCLLLPNACSLFVLVISVPTEQQCVFLLSLSLFI